MNVSAATGVETRCGVSVGHTVWFQIVPTTSGRITFSTCHPATTYDTVVEALKGSDCEILEYLACNDDTLASKCACACSGANSTVSFTVAAGQVYRVVIGSYNNLAAARSVSACTSRSAATTRRRRWPTLSRPRRWPAPAAW